MWSVKHQPRSVTDLATHPKKTEEVRHWLKLSTSSSTSPKALLISGPAGAAKTATLTVLCRELKECNTNEIKMMYLRIIYLYASKKYWILVFLNLNRCAMLYLLMSHEDWKATTLKLCYTKTRLPVKIFIKSKFEVCVIFLGNTTLDWNSRVAQSQRQSFRRGCALRVSDWRLQAFHCPGG